MKRFQSLELCQSCNLNIRHTKKALQFEELFLYVTPIILVF